LRFATGEYFLVCVKSNDFFEGRQRGFSGCLPSFFAYAAGDFQMRNEEYFCLKVAGCHFDDKTAPPTLALAVLLAWRDTVSEVKSAWHHLSNGGMFESDY
jgi:hypothetical protein